ncbi:MAG TPA: hypothetical protein VIH21_03550, partial [Dehalococcoidia bacterium]
ILKAFNAGTYLASVQLTGSVQQFIDNIPTARDIANAEMVAGRKVAIAFFDPTNPTDAVLFAVWT